MHLRTIGVPMDLGADRRGVDMGPSAIRYAGLPDSVRSLGYDYEDVGDLSVPRPEGLDPSAEAPPAGSAKYLREVRLICQKINKSVTEALGDGKFPLVLGGDHSISIGSVSGANRDRDIGVLWIDAHGDFNTPVTTPTGNVHGMSVAAMLGHGAFDEMPWAVADIEAENVAMVGLRDLDPEERIAINDSDVAAYTMSDVDTRGLVTVIEEAIETALDGTDGLHVSLDMDALDPTEGPGVGTPIPGGLSYREAHTTMELVAETEACVSMDVVEVNPILDAHNRTSELAVGLVSSALGERTL